MDALYIFLACYFAMSILLTIACVNKAVQKPSYIIAKVMYPTRTKAHLIKFVLISLLTSPLDLLLFSVTGKSIF